MKNLFLIVCCIVLLGFSSNNPNNDLASYIIDDNSKLRIIGSTNISTFNCDLMFDNVSSKVDILYQKEKNKIMFKDAHLQMANSCFDCGSRLINKDFLEMLNTEKYPYITLNLKEITINQKNPEEVIALVNIEMA